MNAPNSTALSADTQVMNTAQLSKRTGIPAKTIRRYARQLDAIPVKGQTGWIFPDPIDAEDRLLAILRKRDAKRKPRSVK